MNYSLAAIQNRNRRLACHVATVNDVTAAMRQRGLLLYRHHARNGAIEWVLSDGRTVRDVTARAAVAYPGVVGDGALPLIGGPSQTYRLIEQ